MTRVVFLSSRSLLVLAIGLLLAGCGSSDDGNGNGNDDSAAKQYPEASRAAYLNSCTASEGATDEICERSLECIEARFTYEEFDAGEKAMLAGEPNEDFMAKVKDCATKAAS